MERGKKGRCTRNGEEKTERDETAEGARKEAASSRMQDGGFTWLESTRHLRLIF